MIVHVDTQALTISWEGQEFTCRCGKSGAIAQDLGREGDAKTPLGDFPLRFGLWRPDRLPRPRSRLAFHPITDADLWCDAPGHPAYNRWVTASFAASHEVLMRDDMAYDIVLVMGHNDSPPVSGLGSAVFIHLDRPDHRSTLGCVAVEPDAMIRLARDAGPGDVVRIR